MNSVPNKDNNFFVRLTFCKTEGLIYSLSDLLLSLEVKDRILDWAIGATYILNDLL